MAQYGMAWHSMAFGYSVLAWRLGAYGFHSVLFCFVLVYSSHTRGRVIDK